MACVHSRNGQDPRDVYFDAAIEFPPNRFPLTDIKNQLTVFNFQYGSIISSYKELIKMAQDYKIPPYLKFRGICPSWDNTSRRSTSGRVLVHSTPDLFKHWLQELCQFVHGCFLPQERLIFINAWNEWGEGAHLEPDRKYGYAYLQGVADALNEYRNKKSEKIIYVVHDACFNGAQLLSLHIIKFLKLKFNYQVFCLLKAGG